MTMGLACRPALEEILLPTAPPPDRRRWLGLTGLALGVFVTVLDTTVLTVAIPTLIRDLGASLAAIQWVIAGYSLVFASLLVLCGRIGDLFGHRRMVITGLLVFAAGALVASLAHTAAILFAGDALIEGVGAAMMSSSSLALISNEFTGKERAGGAFGLFGGVAGIAGALGPVVGGWLTTDASWRWAFRINVVLAPVLVVLILAGVREVRRAGRRPRIGLAGHHAGCPLLVCRALVAHDARGDTNEGGSECAWTCTRLQPSAAIAPVISVRAS